MVELIAAADRARARLRRRGRLRRRLLRRAVLAGVRRADPPEDRRHGGRRATPTRAASATRATSRSGRAGRRSPSRRPRPGPRRGARAGPAGTSSARRWRGKYLGAGLRHPRRRRRPALPAPRERAGPVARGRAPVRVVLDAQRLDHHRRREDEQVARQLAADPEVLERVRGIELRFYMVAAHYRSHVEFTFEALDEAAAGFRRIEAFLERAGDRASAAGRRRCRTRSSPRWTTTSARRPRSP